MAGVHDRAGKAYGIGTIRDWLAGSVPRSSTGSQGRPGNRQQNNQCYSQNYELLHFFDAPFKTVLRKA
jgi:hypothetical protein